LWFDGAAEEAANLYVSLLGGSITGVSRYGEGAPWPAGTALMVEFELRGRPFQALNGGPHFKFTEAVSMSVACEDQAEIDRLWTRSPRAASSRSAAGSRTATGCRGRSSPPSWGR
jgi:predicted 3-demethylubiquinone-9 3-methyltransferase (glyoxalase superfamily)